jgi:hypothetical protein
LGDGEDGGVGKDSEGGGVLDREKKRRDDEMRRKVSREGRRGREGQVKKR